MTHISVIICCYNGKAHLRPALEHIARQQYDASLEVEFIFVDNASTDGSADYVQKVWSELKTKMSLQIVREEESGLIHARRCGVRVARGKYIVFCDDDNWLREDYVQKAYELMERMSNVGVLGGQGALAPYITAPNWWEGNQCNYAAGKQLLTTGIANERGFLNGAGLVTPRNLAQKIFNGSFPFLLTGRKGNACLSGEDWEYCTRARMMGYDLYYSEDLFYWHDIEGARLTEEYLHKLLHSFELGGTIHEKYQTALAYQQEQWWSHVLTLCGKVGNYIIAPINKKERKKHLLYLYSYMMGLVSKEDCEFDTVKNFMKYAHQVKKERQC